MTEETTNTITLSCVNNTTGETIHIEKSFEGGCTWNQISDVYFRFLCAMGYQLDSDEVGADFSSI